MSTRYNQTLTLERFKEPEMSGQDPKWIRLDDVWNGQIDETSTDHSKDDDAVVKLVSL